MIHRWSDNTHLSKPDLRSGCVAPCRTSLRRGIERRLCPDDPVSLSGAGDFILLVAGAIRALLEATVIGYPIGRLRDLWTVF